MSVVVITGSTRGIGFALANSLLMRGASVVIGGRDRTSTESAAAKLSHKHSPASVLGWASDVRKYEELQSLWDAAVERFGRIDIWINNAGVTNQPEEFVNLETSEIEQVVDTNLLGAVLGTRLAARRMLDQGSGAIYVMEGMGSDGRTHNGLSLYGTTKYALDYFVKAIAAELDGAPVIVGAIRPGMVATDLIIEPYRGEPEEWERVKPIFNIIADPVDQVADWMAGAILENDRNGRVLTRISRLALMLRFLKAPFSKRDLFEDVNLG